MTAESLIARGAAQIACADRKRGERIAANIAEGQADVRRAFVFRFYHDTMLDTHRSGAYHTFGPDSPAPDVQPTCEPGPFGGQYHGVDWTFSWDGLQWFARYYWGIGGGWNLDFYVRGPRRLRWQRAFYARMWHLVHSPAGVADAFSPKVAP